MVHAECKVYASRVSVPNEGGSLPHWELTENHFIDQAKRSMLLDLARMKRCSRDVKSWVSHNLDQTQLSGIESPLGLLKGKSHRLGGSRFSRSAAAKTRMRGLQKHKVPPRVPDPHIQGGRCRIFDRRPLLAESPLCQLHPIRQDAICAKKHRA
jgi:hypothetical protein